MLTEVCNLCTSTLNAKAAMVNRRHKRIANFRNLGSSTTLWNWTSSQIDPRQLTLVTTPPPLSCAQHQSSPGLCAQPPPVQVVQNREIFCKQCQQYISRKSTIMPAGSQRKTYYSTKPRSRSGVEVEQVNNFMFLGITSEPVMDNKHLYPDKKKLRDRLLRTLELSCTLFLLTLTQEQ